MNMPKPKSRPKCPSCYGEGTIDEMECQYCFGTGYDNYFTGKEQDDERDAEE